MNQVTDTASFALLAGEAGFDPIEERLRTNVRATIEAVFEEELASFPGRLRHGRGDGPTQGLSPRAPGAPVHRHLRD
jgi:putative transposase